MISDYNICQTSEKSSSFNRFLDIGKLFEYMKVLKGFYELKRRELLPPGNNDDDDVAVDGRLVISNLSKDAM